MEWTAVSPRSLWNFRISGSFAGNSVCLSSLLLSHYCWATNCCLTIAGRPFVLLLARFSLDLTWFSWRLYWLFRFVNDFSAFECWHSLSSSLGLAKENYLFSSSRLGLGFGFSLRPGRAFVSVLSALSLSLGLFLLTIFSFGLGWLSFVFLAACGLSPPFVARGSGNNSICLLRRWFSFLLCVDLCSCL